jgi:hypothetical protein
MILEEKVNSDKLALGRHLFKCIFNLIFDDNNILKKVGREKMAE